MQIYTQNLLCDSRFLIKMQLKNYFVCDNYIEAVKIDSTYTYVFVKPNIFANVNLNLI